MKQDPTSNKDLDWLHSDYQLISEYEAPSKSFPYFEVIKAIFQFLFTFSLTFIIFFLIYNWLN